jgi:cation transport ATPase
MSGLALVASLIFLFTTHLSYWFAAVSVFCTMIAVAAPAILFFGLQTTINRSSASANKDGAGILGYQAVEELGTVHALALDAMDIFPEYSVLLHGIKTFSGTRIDDAILDAASVSVRAGGPLSHVFRRMIQNKVDMLRDVDTLVYEQDMGLSGWVSGRRVLIGNRKLLDNHGIDIPSQDYEQRYAINGRQLVYLSIAGELSAMFVVSYIADSTVKSVLTKLTKQHVTLLIRTCDQNVTEQLIADVFGLNGFYVEVLNAPAGRSFEALTDGVSETETTGLISNGDRNSLILALAMCNRLHNGTYLFTVLQTLFAVVAMVMIVFTAFAAKVLLSPVHLLLCLLIGCMITLCGTLFSGRK